MLLNKQLCFRKKVHHHFLPLESKVGFRNLFFFPSFFLFSFLFEISALLPGSVSMSVSCHCHRHMVVSSWWWFSFCGFVWEKTAYLSGGFVWEKTAYPSQTEFSRLTTIYEQSRYSGRLWVPPESKVLTNLLYWVWLHLREFANSLKFYVYKCFLSDEKEEILKGPQMVLALCWAYLWD